MIISPIEIQKKEFNKVLRGYNQEEVRQFLEEMSQSYEKVYSENQDLKDQIDALKEKLGDYKNLEETLKNTLVLAEKAAEDVRKSSNREKELILKETMVKATKIIETAQQKHSDVSCEIEELRRHFYLYKTRFTNFLKSQLELVESFEASDIADFEDIGVHLREVAIASDYSYEEEVTSQIEGLQGEINDGENNLTEKLDSDNDDPKN